MRIRLSEHEQAALIAIYNDKHSHDHIKANYMGRNGYDPSRDGSFEPICEVLEAEGLVDIIGVVGDDDHPYLYVLTDKGEKVTRELMNFEKYRTIAEIEKESNERCERLKHEHDNEIL